MAEDATLLTNREKNPTFRRNESSDREDNGSEAPLHSAFRSDARRLPHLPVNLFRSEWLFSAIQDTPLGRPEGSEQPRPQQQFPPPLPMHQPQRPQSPTDTHLLRAAKTVSKNASYSCGRHLYHRPGCVPVRALRLSRVPFCPSQ